MTTREDPISVVDINALKSAYGALLAGREAMLESFVRAGEDSPLRREVIVDGIITGVMTHLHSVVNNQQAFEQVLLSNGGGRFYRYADLFVNQIVDVTRAIEGKSDTDVQANPVKPAKPPKRRTSGR